MRVEAHGDEHEILLAEFLAGEPLSRDARDSLERCADCRRALDELRGVSAALVESASERATDLDAAAEPTPAPGEAQLLHRLHELSVREPHGIPVRRRRFLALALAASVVAAGALWWRTSSKREPEVPHVPVELGGNEDIELLQPLGPTRTMEFAWRDVAPAAGGYWLEIRDAALEPEAAPVLRELCPDPSWSPGADQRARMPRTIRWLVIPREADGTELAASSSANAEFLP